MMETLKLNQQKALGFISANQGSNLDDIAAGAKLNRLVAVGSLKQLVDLKLVTIEEKDGKQLYTATGNIKPEKAKKTAEKPAAEKPEPEEKKEDKEPKLKAGKSKSGKDFSTYKFQGVEYKKGRLIHAMIAHYAQQHEPTLAELKDAFPADQIKPYGYGLFRPLSEAKTINTESGRTRFLTKDEEAVKLKGSRIAVTNQVTADLLERFLTHAKKHKLYVK
jgi:hypothetical protein